MGMRAKFGVRHASYALAADGAGGHRVVRLKERACRG